MDTEFCLRLAGAGFRMVVPRTRSCTIRWEGKHNQYHGENALTLSHPPVRRYYISRDRLHLMKNFFSRFRSFFLFHLREAFIDLVRVILFEETDGKRRSIPLRGIRDGICGRLGPAIPGKGCGMREGSIRSVDKLNCRKTELIS